MGSQPRPCSDSQGQTGKMAGAPFVLRQGPITGG